MARSSLPPPEHKTTRWGDEHKKKRRWGASHEWSHCLVIGGNSGCPVTAWAELKLMPFICCNVCLYIISGPRSKSKLCSFMSLKQLMHSWIALFQLSTPIKNSTFHTLIQGSSSTVSSRRTIAAWPHIILYFECISFFFVSCARRAAFFTLVFFYNTGKWIIGNTQASLQAYTNTDTHTWLKSNLVPDRCPAGRETRMGRAGCLHTWCCLSAPAWARRPRARLYSCPCILRRSRFRKTHSWRGTWSVKKCNGPNPYLFTAPDHLKLNMRKTSVASLGMWQQRFQ